MNNIKSNHLASIIKIACAIMFMITDIGCNHEPQTITGKVVDESGVALSDVAVMACYSGWGWSKGSVVWDKDYCSETVLTGNDGLYVISFEGPVSMRLMAKKEGWIQTQDFNTLDSHIILIKREDYSARQTAESRMREDAYRQRLPDESDTEYYCRVILSRNRPVKLNYNDETISITPILLMYDDRSNALFALRGSSRIASLFSNEAIFKFNGQTLNSNFSHRLGATKCGSNVHILNFHFPSLSLGAGEQIEIFIPSIHAMFDMQIWRHPVKP
jgi:hypothetical protein